jgi:Ni,Fe-hydrogenase maturation factor
MNIYIFGNQDYKDDSLAIILSEKFKNKFKQINFIRVLPNEDLPFIDEKNVIILDTVLGIDKITEIKNKDLDKLILSKSLTVHDFDLGFQLKYLQKLGKIGNVTIIGIPMNRDINYLRIQSILRKLVAQDIQGS